MIVAALYFRDHCCTILQAGNLGGRAMVQSNIQEASPATDKTSQQKSSIHSHHERRRLHSKQGCIKQSVDLDEPDEPESKHILPDVTDVGEENYLRKTGTPEEAFESPYSKSRKIYKRESGGNYGVVMDSNIDEKPHQEQPDTKVHSHPRLSRQKSRSHENLSQLDIQEFEEEQLRVTNRSHSPSPAGTVVRGHLQPLVVRPKLNRAQTAAADFCSWSAASAAKTSPSASKPHRHRHQTRHIDANIEDHFDENDLSDCKHHVREEDQYYQSRSTNEQPTIEGRDTINLEEYHIVAKIPTGEQGVNDVTIQVIEKAPSDLILKEDQSIIAVGLKFSPSGLQFSTPLRITIPHSAIFTSPEKAKIFLYTRANDGDTFSGVSPSANGTPRCVVRHDDLDLYIDHFSEWWIITYLRETFIGKRLMCTPYIPLLRPKNVAHCIIMSLKDDVRGTTENIPDYKAALPGTQFLVRWRYGKLGVTCRVEDKQISHKSMEERELYYLINHRMYFQLEPIGPDTLQVMVEFILRQVITKMIMFPLLTEAYLLDIDLHTHGPSTSSTSSEKDQMTKSLAETSRARRSTSLGSSLDKEDDRYYYSRSTDKPTTTEERDTINLEEYHIVAKIPAGEEGVNDITIQVIEKAPSDLILKEDQSIISVGLKFSPPGLQFSSPLKVTLPHSAIFTNPRKANIVFYMRNDDVNIFSEVSPSADGTPRCEVRQDDLDLYIDHFSEWWIITYLRETFIGKRLICTPYIPVSTARNKYIILCLEDDTKGPETVIPNFKVAGPRIQYVVRWGKGNLSIRYLVNKTELLPKVLEEREFYYLNNHLEHFPLDPNDWNGLQVMVEFILSQYIKKEIMFPVEFQEEPCSMSSSTQTYQMDAAFNVARHSRLADSPEDELTDAHVHRLSELLNPSHFSAMHVALGIPYDTAVGILTANMNSYPAAYRALMHIWKDESERTLDNLDDVLRQADVGGLIPKYRRCSSVANNRQEPEERRSWTSYCLVM